MKKENNLIFATANKNKIREISKMLPAEFEYEIISMHDAGIYEDIPETADSIKGNAVQKAMYIHEKYGYNSIAEDTGLFIDSLGGEPGIYTARYAGDEKNPEKNMQKALAKLEAAKDRNARFVTVIALVIEGEIFTFEGVCEGEISKEKRGDAGFGYDPVFIPRGYNKTFAQLPADEKNKISHRAKALKKLVNFLNK